MKFKLQVQTSGSNFRFKLQVQTENSSDRLRLVFLCGEILELLQRGAEDIESSPTCCNAQGCQHRHNPKIKIHNRVSQATSYVSFLPELGSFS
jgi:hypothetical protein